MVPSHQSNEPNDTPAIVGEPGARNTPRASRSVRVISGGDGHHWIVREFAPRSFDRGVGSLVFVSDHAMRKVRNYPADWFEQSDADLLAVSLRR